MGSDSKFSPQAVKLLKAFLDMYEQDVRAEISGADVMRAAKLSSGTVYPLLYKYEENGLLESRWEELSAEELGRPRRRLYSLRGEGAAVARKAVEELREAFSFLVPRQV